MHVCTCLCIAELAVVGAAPVLGLAVFFVHNCECVFIYLIWVLDDALEVVLRF